jgi:hypothetical protein
MGSMPAVLIWICPAKVSNLSQSVKLLTLVCLDAGDNIDNFEDDGEFEDGVQIPDNSIVDSESSDGRGWPEDEDEPEDQPGDYEMEDAEELDETVSKKQPSTRVSRF